MNRIGTALGNVLIGAVVDDVTSDAARDSLLVAGRPPEDVVVLAGEDGLDELLSNGVAHVHYIGRWTVADSGAVP